MKDGTAGGNRFKTNDSVVFFNFRPDRAREITRAFCDDNLTDLTEETSEDLTYVCFTEYDATIPEQDRLHSTK